MKARPARPPRTPPATTPGEGPSEESPESLSSAAGLEGEAGSPAQPPRDASGLGLEVMMLARELEVPVVPEVVTGVLLLGLGLRLRLRLLEGSSTLSVDGVGKMVDETLLG